MKRFVKEYANETIEEIRNMNADKQLKIDNIAYIEKILNGYYDQQIISTQEAMWSIMEIYKSMRDNEV